MSENELENQPAVAAEDAYLEDPSEDVTPKEKAGVYIDPNEAMQTPRFFKNDKVHMSETTDGVRGKGIYQIYKSRYNRRGGFIEYQLTHPLTGQKHKNGAWYREKDLRLERRG